MALFMICAYVGYSKPSGIKRRVIALEELEGDIRRLDMLMEHRKLPIEQLIAGLDSPLWEEVSRLMKSRDTSLFNAWMAALELMTEDGRLRCLNGGDMAVLTDFGDALGVSDTSAQASNAALAIKRLKERREAAAMELLKKQRLFRSLGVLGGAAAALMVI